MSRFDLNTNHYKLNSALHLFGKKSSLQKEDEPENLEVKQTFKGEVH